MSLHCAALIWRKNSNVLARNLWFMHMPLNFRFRSIVQTEANECCSLWSMPTLKWTYLQCMLRLLEAVEAVWLERKIGAKLGVVIFYWRYFARVWVVSVVIVIRWGRKAVSPTTKETNCMIHRHLDEKNYQLWFPFSLSSSNNRHHCNILSDHTLNFNDWIGNRKIWCVVIWQKNLLLIYDSRQPLLVPSSVSGFKICPKCLPRILFLVKF